MKQAFHDNVEPFLVLAESDGDRLHTRRARRSRQLMLHRLLPELCPAFLPRPNPACA